MSKTGSVSIDSPDCLNCGTVLRGQYCGNCGQRAHSRLISLWQLMREAFGDLFELDSRLWRTLGPLLRKPGELTKEYLRGRRARYMPPFRTYLVLSIIFFVVALFDPKDDFGLLFEPEAQATAEETEQELQAAREKLNQLAEQGVISPDVAAEFETEITGDEGFNIQFDEDGEAGCNIDADDWNEFPDWIKRRITRDRALQACDRIRADQGRNFLNLLLDKIPVALIVLLPLMALVLKVLYPLSRRYFVEHLLFFVHFHAFFFLILTLQVLFGRLAGLLSLPQAIPILIIVAASFYIPLYLYLAMRRVYGQGHLVTIGKYIVLFIAYMMGASLTLLGAVVFALLSI